MRYEDGPAAAIGLEDIDPAVGSLRDTLRESWNRYPSDTGYPTRGVRIPANLITHSEGK